MFILLYIHPRMWFSRNLINFLGEKFFIVKVKYTINQKVFAVIIGLTISYYAYKWVVDPAPRLQRQAEERIVSHARKSVFQLLELTEQTKVIDPLNPNKKVGKTYLAPNDNGWQVSGYLRRDEAEPWYPWLISLDNNLDIVELRIQGDKSLFADDIINSDKIFILPVQ